MPLNPDMRAADSDRDRVAEALREHCAQGRITMDELHERLEAAYAAKTIGELREVTADLPDDDYHTRPIPASHRTPPATRRSGGTLSTGLPGGWATYATVNLICVTIWLIVAVTGGGLQGLWPLWVAGPWGAVLLAVSVFGSRRDS